MLDTDLWNLCMNLYFCENIYEVKATKICVLLPGNHVTNVEYYFLVESTRPKEELSSEICKEKANKCSKAEESSYYKGIQQVSRYKNTSILSGKCLT